MKDWIIGILVLLNLALLAFLWYSPKPEEAPHPEKKMFQHISRVLDLNEEQQAEFEALRKSYFQENRELHRHIRENKRAILHALEHSEYDSTKLEDLSRDNAALHYEMEQLMISHFQELEALCTPEQREELHHLFIRSLREHGPGKGHGKHRREHQDH